MTLRADDDDDDDDDIPAATSVSKGSSKVAWRQSQILGCPLALFRPIRQRWLLPWSFIPYVRRSLYVSSQRELLGDSRTSWIFFFALFTLYGL